MNFLIDRNFLYQSLQRVISVIGGRPRMPVLSHILLEVHNNYLLITATDLEIEIIVQIALENEYSVGSSTVPGRKFFEICRSLSASSKISVILKDNQLIVSSGSSKFSLSTFPASDFPKSEEWNDKIKLAISEIVLKKMIELTHFSMGHQDVRYYLNGVLFEVQKNVIRMVATDGHRLASCEASIDELSLSSQSIIIPRKGIIEILRLLSSEGRVVDVKINTNSVRIRVDNYIITSKLIDAVFPNYSSVFFKNSDNVLKISCSVLKCALKRVAILSNEKLRVVKFNLMTNRLVITAHNLEHETSEETLNVSYVGQNMDISFNVDYLLDILHVMESYVLQFFFVNATSSIQIEEVSKQYGVKYVIMPIRV